MDKKQLSERDICTKFITPALRQAGWDEMLQIREEVSFTKGRIIVRGKLVTRAVILWRRHVPKRDAAVQGWEESSEVRTSYTVSGLAWRQIAACLSGCAAARRLPLLAARCRSAKHGRSVSWGAGRDNACRGTAISYTVPLHLSICLTPDKKFRTDDARAAHPRHEGRSPTIMGSFATNGPGADLARPTVCSQAGSGGTPHTRRRRTAIVEALPGNRWGACQARSNSASATRSRS
jgi:hypothetical protein